MENALKKFKDFTERGALIKRGERILVALSGGPDSVFLLKMLCLIREEYNLQLGAVHLNHNLRATAKRDEDFCRKLCEECGVRFYPFSCDIKALSEKLGVSLEEAGRTKRYEIIESFRGEYDKTATAHHADDNAETILMHIIRGSGIDGLCGIPKERGGYIIRPLLCFEKSEIVEWLNNNKTDYMTDETNAENIYFRNRIRNVIIPQLKNENPNIVKGLNYLAEAVKMYADMTDKRADTIKISKTNGGVWADYEAVKKEDGAVKYALLKKMASTAGAGSDLSFESMKQVYELLENEENTVWSCDAAHITFLRRYDKIYARIPDTAEDYETYESGFSYGLRVPSMNIFSREGFSLRLYLQSGSEAKTLPKNSKNIGERYITAVDYDKITNNITVRSRRDGDSYKQIGLTGTKTVNRLFIDRKLEREKRGKVPIILCGDEIVCICGFETDARYAITAETANKLVIEYESWENLSWKKTSKKY